MDGRKDSSWYSCPHAGLKGFFEGKVKEKLYSRVECFLIVLRIFRN